MAILKQGMSNKKAELKDSKKAPLFVIILIVYPASMAGMFSIEILFLPLQLAYIDCLKYSFRMRFPTHKKFQL